MTTDPSSIPGPPAAGPLAELDRAALLQRYAVGVERIPRATLDLSAEELDRTFDPATGLGRWSVRGLLSHLADAELVLTHRMRRQVAEDRPVFTMWDPDAFIERTVYGEADRAERLPPAGFVAVIHTMRRWNAEWLHTLGDAVWQRSGLHPEQGEQTLRAQVEKATWHLEHHAGFLARKLAAMANAGGAGASNGGPGAGA